MDTNDLQPGDVLFFRTARVTMAEGFDRLLALGTDKTIEQVENGEGEETGDFPALAALVQSYPYSITGNGYRPWFHVVVAVSTTHAVGFDLREIDEEGNDDIGNAVVQRFEIDVAAWRNLEIDVDVVRCEESSSIATEAERAADGAATTYSLAGLLSFARSILGYMTPEGRARDYHLERARGFDVVVRGLDDHKTGETCATSTALWIEAALGKKLPFHPPPTIRSANPAPKETIDRMQALVRQLEQRAFGGRVGALLQEQDQEDRPFFTIDIDEQIVFGPQAVLESNALARLEFETRAVDKLLSEGRFNFPIVLGNPLFGQILEQSGVNGGPIPGLESMPSVGINLGILDASYRHAATAVSGVPDEDIVSEGREERPIEANSLYLSPAMLWEALMCCGCQSIGTLASSNAGT